MTTSRLSPRVRRVRSPDGVLELVQALLAHVAPAGFEPVAEELEPLPRRAAVADMRLLGMQRQAVRLHPRANLVECGVGGLACPAQDHEVIRVPHHAIAARGHQLVQRVEIDVGQQRADDCPLGAARRRRPPVETLQDVGLQPAADQVEHATVDDVLLDPRHQTIVRNRVEIAFQVGIYHEGIAIPDQLIDLPQGVVASALRTEAVAAVREAVLEDRLDDEPDGLLDDAVLDRGDAQRSRSAIALRDVHPLDGLRSVRALPQRRRQLRQIEICLRCEPLDRLPVHTRGTFVGADLRPRQGQCLGCEHLVHQAEPLAAFDAVHQRRQHTLRPHLGFGPRKSWADLCIARSRRRHSRCCSCLGRGLHVSTFLPCLPSDRFMFSGLSASGLDPVAAVLCGL